MPRGGGCRKSAGLRGLTSNGRARYIGRSNRFGAVSSRGQDTWFSATGPGFESPYRYQCFHWFTAGAAEAWSSL
jgi:hypothetical protein